MTHTSILLPRYPIRRFEPTQLDLRPKEISGCHQNAMRTRVGYSVQYSQWCSIKALEVTATPATGSRRGAQELIRKPRPLSVIRNRRLNNVALVAHTTQFSSVQYTRLRSNDRSSY